ncbi:MAG: cob(I)yrinic acid a,c-diamide adenosyltransferase [Proteobacteria bacterium]|nr:MAG: cob(I)yrinic acid a,c-diamide adenosyltransferase [Pseudomonadota bacterium]
MGHRLSKIYTRTGDDGTTGLGDGTRVSKDSLRVEAYGTVDELNSVIGLLLTHTLPEAIHACLVGVQHRLFDLGGELCLPGHTAIKQHHVNELEQILDDLNANLSPLKDFILPGGSTAAAVCHVARSVCRRAERRIISLSKQEQVSEVAIHYLNRLSDLLFVIGRTLNAEADYSDVLWRSAESDGNKTDGN